MKKPPRLPTIPPVTLDGYELDVQYYVQQEYLDISQAAVELPTIIEYLNWQTQIHIEAKMSKKAELERVEARVWFELKNGEFQRLGYGDKPTEKAMDHAVALNEDVIALKDEIGIFSGWVERLSNIQRSLQFKLELVRSSEATRRKIVE